ncbi:MAG TPA: hypothetical protein DDX92_12220 [Flavobacteriales bacterium]|jgi:DNA mismatch repair ATPase MutS|nr:hypothetical protein [Flavobacteriales bacterium]
MSFIYNSRISQFEFQLKKYRNAARNLSWLRALIFVLILGGIYNYWGQWLTMSLVTTVGIGLFIRLIILSLKANNEVKYYEKIIELNQNEIKALEGKWENPENGKKWENHKHSYSRDLDIFGESSLYAKLNRTVTINGSQKLAKWLQNLTLSADEIQRKQQAIEELKKDLDWRQDFLTKGALNPLSERDIQNIKNWRKTDIQFGKFHSFLLWTIPLVSLAVAVFWGLGYLSFYQGLLYFFLVPLGYTGLNIKKLNQYHENITTVTHNLKSLSALLECIENKEFNSDILARSKAEIEANQGRKASRAVRILQKHLGQFDQRINLLAGLIMNALLLWDYHHIRILEDWKTKHSSELDTWIENTGTLDAYCSFANLAMNRGDFVYPEFSDEPLFLSVENTAHPLMPGKDAVRNSFEQKGSGAVSIITGANMAGKSTFLRTIGVNLVLAMNGSVVNCTSMLFNPAVLFTSMSVSDSLKDNESYFFAELSRLSQLDEILNQGTPTYALLDEILKGTNSRDKEEGSKAFVRKLTSRKVSAIVATHDLGLCELESEFPERIRNQSFDVLIDQDELRFDYTLKDGICTQMNATFLLRKMGIVE